MRILIAIDDTDNLESRGTGEIASLIADGLEQRGWGSCSFVTRHQLFVHPDIPYTSHNSAMCFYAEIGEGALAPVTEFVSDFLGRESAPGSDPGLCVVVPERVTSEDELMAFGRRAKREVITMDEAYGLARRLGVHLSQHGGTGQGVIGALAGAGLRLWGNDGRLKGALEFAQPCPTLRVAELLQHPLVDAVRCADGGAPHEDDLVSIGEKPKTVLLGGSSVLLVSPLDDASAARWQTLHRKRLRGY
ncbi:Predicted DNA-binding protein containing a Zn-ribbon domain [Citrifermentans bremense]|uniref:Predicted DNA-binding protein containing a Zn-ribbon domain n=1 Tax=Citrifermentans bremense TaxID=60035 RepID=A0A6S6M324_9BACT|nr:hypothetical protein [Citrifermentans bremense]BCG46051.1 Predicted DNA-binding protein containing a Zn-ribbon domain [Citrifermentans bremense]